MRRKPLIVTMVLMLALVAMFMVACGDDGATTSSTPGETTDTTGPATGDPIKMGFDEGFTGFMAYDVALAEKGILTALAMVDNQVLGRPIEYIKVSGGIFLDMMIHDFDMARYIVGDEVEEIYAVGGVRIDPEIGKAGDIDTAVVTLQFGGGCFATIDNSRQAVYGYDQRLEVFGPKGMVCTDNDTPNRIRLSTARTVQEDLPLYFFMERYTESYLNEMNAFIQCIRDDGDPPVTGTDGRLPVVMGKAARLSWEQKRPVALREVT